MSEMFPGQFNFREGLGRNRDPFRFKAETEEDFFAQVKTRLLSSDIEYVYHPEISIGEVFVGLFAVGVFSRSELEDSNAPQG